MWSHLLSRLILPTGYQGPLVIQGRVQLVVLALQGMDLEIEQW